MRASSAPDKAVSSPAVDLLKLAWGYVVAIATLVTLQGCGENQRTVSAADNSRTIDPSCRPLMPIIGLQPHDDRGYLGLLAENLLRNDRGESKLHMLQAGDQRESAVQVVQADDGSYGVVSRRMSEPVFASTEDYRGLEVVVETHQAPIPAEVFRNLDGLWREFLFRIRVPQSLDSFDRPHYYFSGTAGPLIVTGYADGPKPGTCIGQLRDIGDLLFALPGLDDAQRATQLLRLARQIAALRERLDKTGGR